MERRNFDKTNFFRTNFNKKIMNSKYITLTFLLAFPLLVWGQSAVEEVSLCNLEFNTSQEDFAAVPYGEGIMYNTTGDKNKCDTCGYFYNLRYTQKRPGEDCSFSPAVMVPGAVQAKYNYGTPTFSSDGKQMILSQNFNEPGGAGNQRGKKLKLVSAQLSDQNSWINLTELPFNDKNYETTHPTLSPDGQTLYFASNREGGLGGMDIWMVGKQGDSWGSPVNLGASVNTAGNELFPYISSRGVLYFSSNREGGMGQLDIYESRQSDAGWSASTNLGAPFNSSADDIGYVVLADGESGYLTSNRAGGKGKDDVYGWKINQAPVILAVVDGETEKRLSGAKVNIAGPIQTIDHITDANGNAVPEIIYRRNYTITVEKEGYELWSKQVTPNELAAVKEYVIPLTPGDYNIEGEVRLIGSEEPVPGALIVLHNLTTGEKREFTADEYGNFTFSAIRCFEDYELIATKEDRSSEIYPLPATLIDCSKDESVKLILRIPVPPAPVCDCTDAGMLSLSVDESAKKITALGSRPQFGDSHDLDGAGFYQKLKQRYDSSERDASFLNELFQEMGYQNGFEEVGPDAFSETEIPNGMTGKMGYTKNHRIKYVQLNAKRERDLQAFRVSAANGCDTYFMKTCGNLFFFCSPEEEE